MQSTFMWNKRHRTIELGEKRTFSLAQSMALLTRLFSVGILILFNTSKVKYCSLLPRSHRFKNSSSAGTNFPSAPRTISVLFVVWPCSDKANNILKAKAGGSEEVSRACWRSSIYWESISIVGCLGSSVLDFCRLRFLCPFGVGFVVAGHTVEMDCCCCCSFFFGTWSVGLSGGATSVFLLFLLLKNPIETANTTRPFYFVLAAGRSEERKANGLSETIKARFPPRKKSIVMV